MGDVTFRAGWIDDDALVGLSDAAWRAWHQGIANSFPAHGHRYVTATGTDTPATSLAVGELIAVGLILPARGGTAYLLAREGDLFTIEETTE